MAKKRMGPWRGRGNSAGRIFTGRTVDEALDKAGIPPSPKITPLVDDGCVMCRHTKREHSSEDGICRAIVHDGNTGFPIHCGCHEFQLPPQPEPPKPEPTVRTVDGVRILE